ncbi:MAG TPA: N-acetylmuramoyl-L-alanine amidase [Thermoanaerobaculia bacterium]|jgi:N-acetylmuramoyl-L-alanine amidase|nr:N-acetylmuramoyl-L-alanine amidase [Thermoanaerobaculia bacterium]
MTARMNRVKRRLVEQAVADNLDTIRGLPPRSVRPSNRAFRIWLKRTPFFVLFLLLAGSTYLASNPTAAHDTIAPAKIVITRARRPVAQASVIDSAGMSMTALPLSVHRVVIDAGHGGNDPGTTSPALLSEKDVTLDVARRLSALLQKNGFEVVTTRTDDRLIPLRERARLANQSDSDIFVSIHVNSIEQHTSEHGVETYYLGPTKDPSLTKLAADENRVSGYSVADLRKLLDGIYADARRDESQRLAAAVQQQLFTNLKTNDRGLENWGVKRAPFIVLVATEMPAILAEVGCMSNANEVTMLQRANYRQEIAEALFAGINEYSKKGT